MALFWLVYRTEDDLNISIQEASSLISARLKAALAGLAGEFAEGHQLDVKTAKRLPKDIVGRALTRDEAQVLLAKLGGDRL